MSLDNKRLHPTWLKTFITLVETGHFTRTADLLFMTQPGVSQHIKKLEQACGQALISRVNKQCHITDAGKKVYHYALKAQKLERELIETINQQDPYSGEYRLASSGALALRLFPVLLRLQRQYPKLQTHLEAAPNHQMLQGVKNGALDVALVTSTPSEGLYESELIGYEPLCLILPAHLDLSPNQTAFDPVECLTSLGLIHHPDIEHYLSLYLGKTALSELNALTPQHFAKKAYINQIHQILDPVAEGLGFTVLPQSALDSFPRRHQVQVLEHQHPVTEPLYWVTKRHRPLPKRFDKLKQRIKATLEQSHEA